MCTNMTITIISLWDASMHKYSAITDEADPMKILEQFFIRQQDDHKDAASIPSMSTGDIVGINGALYLCQSRGWKRLDHSLFLAWLESSPQKRAFNAMGLG